MSRGRRLWELAVLAGLLFALLPNRSGVAHAAGTSCYAAYHATCYSPAEVSQAERAMTVRPVDPTPAVLRTTHLPLVSVIVERQRIGTGANVIFYSYGVKVALDKPMRPSSHPGLFVTEFALPKASSSSTLKSQPGTIPSVLGTFAHRKLAILVGGRFPMSLLRAIARQVLSG
jgi:hypothetical protein